MKNYELFYKNGFEEFSFNPLSLNSVLREILNENLLDGFSLQKKYSSTLDLRPNVIDYHPDFLLVLKENKIKNFLRSRVLRDLTLQHVQVRISESPQSYMDWHRDTYFSENRKIGMMPPGIKIIYYPNLNDEDSSQTMLKVSEGSHRLMIDNDVPKDISVINFLPIRHIRSNSNSAVAFDTSILHAVEPDPVGKKSIRLIYSFLPKEQIEESEELFHRTSKKYEELF